MRFRDKYFPYPVIRPVNEDFTNSTFDINLSQKTIDNDLIIEGEILIDNEDIIKQVELGNARYVLHLEESETMFRQAYFFKDLTFKITVSLDLVRTDLEIVSFITAINPINNFYSPDLANIYEGISISYDTNNIIGVGTPMIIDIVKENDDIEAVSSIFMVIPSEDVEEIFQLSLDSDRVTIMVSDETFKLYNDLSKSFRITNSKDNIILLTLMVMPAFVETLNILKQDYASYESSKWYISLVDAFAKKQIDIIEEFEKDDFDSYEHAQIIFDVIIDKSLKRLKELSLEEN